MRHHFLLILSLFSLVSCTSTEKEPPLYTSEEKGWMTELFRGMLTIDHFAFTLWGSKPMAFISLPPDYTQEEIDLFFASLTEEQKKGLTVVEEYNLKANWERWKAISHRFPMHKFMLFENTYWQEGGSNKHIFLVNVLRTALVLQENYELFQKAVGFDFHPLEVTLQINENDSVFWSQVMRNRPDLLGLLLGFGKLNAFAFHWKYWDHPDSCAEFCETLRLVPSNPWKPKIDSSLEALELPSFVCFDEEDETIKKYEKEREFIQKTYRGKNFLDHTLNRLCE